MTSQSLSERRKQAEVEFNALETQKQEHQAEIKNIENRQSELRGQYQLLTEQLATAELAVSPSADVIDVEAAQKAKKK